MRKWSSADPAFSKAQNVSNELNQPLTTSPKSLLLHFLSHNLVEHFPDVMTQFWSAMTRRFANKCIFSDKIRLLTITAWLCHWWHHPSCIKCCLSITKLIMSSPYLCWFSILQKKSITELINVENMYIINIVNLLYTEVWHTFHC